MYCTRQDNNLASRRESKLCKALTLIEIFLASFLLFTFVSPRTNVQSGISFNIYNHDEIFASQSWHHHHQQQHHHRQLAVSSPTVDAPLENFLYIIIHYHKTGHDLSRSLIDMISAGIPDIPKPIVWKRKTMINSYSNAVKVGFTLLLKSLGLPWLGRICFYFILLRPIFQS